MANKPPLTVRSVVKGIKSATQMIAESTKEVVTEVMPNTSQTLASAHNEASNTLNQSLNRVRSDMDKYSNHVARTKLGRKIQSAFIKAVDKIDSSNYSSRQLSMELEHSSLDFDEDSFSSSDEGNDSFNYANSQSVKAMAAVNRSINVNGLAQIKSNANMTNTLANVNLEGTKAIAATIENMSMAQTNILHGGLSEMKSGISTTNSLLSSILDFMNTNVSPSNENITNALSTIAAKLDEMSSNKSNSIAREHSPEENPLEKFFSDGAGFNIGEYKKKVREGFDTTTVGQGINAIRTLASTYAPAARGGVGGSVKGMGKDFAKFFAKSIVGGAIGVDTKSKLMDADREITSAITHLLYRLGDLETNGRNGLEILLGRLLGIKRPQMTRIDMSKGRKDEVIGWNGVAQTALTQVIPNYLASIESSITGSAMKYYDYDSGVFKTQEELMDDLVVKMVEMNNAAFSEPVSRLIKGLERNGASSYDVTKLVNSINDLLNKRMFTINDDGSLGTGYTDEYRMRINTLLGNAKISEKDSAKIQASIEESLNEITRSMNEFYATISDESTESLKYRNIFNAFNESTRRKAEAFDKASKARMSPRQFNSALGLDDGGYTASREDAFGKRIYDQIRKTGERDLLGGDEIGSAIGDAIKTIGEGITVRAFIPEFHREIYEENAERERIGLEKEGKIASSQADKFRKRSGYKFDEYGNIDYDSMNDAKNKSINMTIGESIATGRTENMIQGLVMSLHSNLLVPMYRDFFSKDGMIQKVFGDDPNSTLNLLREKLFGDEEGILTPMINWLKYQITGKGYTARDGTVYEDKDQNLLAYAKDLYGDFFNSSMVSLFDSDYAKSEQYQKYFRWASPEGLRDIKNSFGKYKDDLKIEAEYDAKLKSIRDRIIRNEVITSADLTLAKRMLNSVALLRDEHPGIYKRITKKNEDLFDELAGLGITMEFKKKKPRKFFGTGIGYYSQHNPLWSNIITGIMDNGEVSTMDNAGCGPTALSFLASLYHKNIKPGEILKIARENGFLSGGGATEDLFTKGASMIGLKGRKISFSAAIDNAKNGIPSIIAGKSRGLSSIFSKQGHIVALVGADDDKLAVMDPETGFISKQDMSKFKGVSDAFSYEKPLGFSNESSISSTQPQSTNINPSRTQRVNPIDTTNKVLSEINSKILPQKRTHILYNAIADIHELIYGAYYHLFGSPNQQIQGLTNSGQNLNIAQKSTTQVVKNEQNVHIYEAGYENATIGVTNAVINITGKALIKQIGEVIDQGDQINTQIPLPTPINELDSKIDAKLEETKNEQLKDEIQKLEDAITVGAGNASTIISDTIEDPKHFKDRFMRQMSQINAKYKDLPKSLAKGALAGGAIGLLHLGGRGLLTSMFLPTGLVGGAIVGLGTTLLAKSKTMNRILFGGEDKDGIMHEGIITKSQADAFKQAMPYAIGGATLGVLKHVIGGAIGLPTPTGLITGALLGTGPIGAGIVGLGLGILKNNETLQKKLFGTKGADNKRSGGILSGTLNATSKVVKSSSEYLKKGIKGAGFGLIGGAALAEMGLLGGALTLGGPVGMAIAGLGLGIASNTDRFNRYLFGDEYIDEEGVASRHKNGLIHRSMELIMDEAIIPMKHTIEDNLSDFGIWAKKNIELPFKLAFGPIADDFSKFKRELTDTVKETFDTVGENIIAIFSGGIERLLSPITRAVSGGFNLAGKATRYTAQFVGGAATMPLKLLALTQYRKRKQEDKAYRNALFDDLTGKWTVDDAGDKYNRRFGSLLRLRDRAKDLLGMGGFADEAVEAAARGEWGEGMDAAGRNRLGWFQALANYNLAKKKHDVEKQNRENFRQSERLASKWKKQDRYNEDMGWTDEVLDERVRQLRKLGIIGDGIKTESQVKEFMYRRKDWQSKYGEFGTENLLAKTLEAKIEESKTKDDAHKEATEKYQGKVLNILENIFEHLRVTSAARSADIVTEEVDKAIDTRNSRLYKKFNVTTKDIGMISKFLRGDIDLSEDILERFQEAQALAEAEGREFYIDKETYDRMMEQRKNVVNVKSYEEVIEEIRAEEKEEEIKLREEERKASIDNTDLFDDLLNRKIIPPFIHTELMREYKNEDFSSLNRLIDVVQDKYDYLYEGLKPKTSVDNDVDMTETMQEFTEANWVGEDIASRAIIHQADLESKGKKIGLHNWLATIKNLISDSIMDAYEDIDKEEDEEDLAEAELIREAEETAAAQALGAEAEEGKDHFADTHKRRWYDSFTTKKDGSMNLIGKGFNAVQKSWIGRLASGIFGFGVKVKDSPLLQAALMVGGFVFKDQIGAVIGGLAKGVKDVATEYLPDAINFVTDEAIPWVFSHVTDVAETAITVMWQSIPMLRDSLLDLGSTFLDWIGWNNKTTAYSAEDVNLNTGYTLDAKKLARWYNPETGEYEYITNKDGKYQVLDDYQYITDDGRIANISRGTGGNLARYGFQVIKNPSNAASGLKLVGRSLNATSSLVSWIPGIGRPFKLTKAAGKGMTELSKTMSKSLKEGGKKTTLDLLGEAADRQAGVFGSKYANRVMKDEITGISEELAKNLSGIDNLLVKNKKGRADSKNVKEIVELFRENGIKNGDSFYSSRDVAKIINTANEEQISNLRKQISSIYENRAKESVEDVVHGISKKAKFVDATKLVEEGTSEVLNRAGDIIRKSSDDIGVESAKGLINRLTTWVKKNAKKLFSKIIDDNVITAVVKRFDDFCTGFLGCSSKTLTNFAGSCASGVFKGASKMLPYIGIVLTAYDGIMGFANTETLFGVPEGMADGTMRIVSTFTNVILGTAVGAIFDIMLTIYSSVTGEDQKRKFAQEIYVTILETFGNDKALEDFSNAQAIMEKELENYNDAHVGGELTMDEYLELKEQSNSWWNKIKRSLGLKSAIEDMNIYATSAGSHNASNVGYNIIINNENYNTTVTSDNKEEVPGYGKAVVGYGFKNSSLTSYAQNDPRWANFKLGTLPNGNIATMQLAGCGPTALANISNATPLEVAQMAVNKGYITNGGANAKLFESGARDLGLEGKKISTNHVFSHLKNGEKIIVSGVSEYGGLFTEAGHIVTLESIDGNQVLVSDPLTGEISAYSMNKISPYLTNAWAYKDQYGKAKHIIDPIANESIGYGLYDSISAIDPYMNPEDIAYSNYKISHSEAAEYMKDVKRLIKPASLFSTDKKHKGEYKDFYNNAFSDSRLYTIDDIIGIKEGANNDSSEISILRKVIEEWWSNLSDTERKLELNRWLYSYNYRYNKGVNNFGSSLNNSIKSLGLNPKGYDIEAMIEFVLMPKVAKEIEKLTNSELMSIHTLHGYKNIDFDIYDEENVNKARMEIASDNLKAAIAECIEKVVASPNDPNVYLPSEDNAKGINPVVILKLNDPLYGGNESLNDSWLYSKITKYLNSPDLNGKTDEQKIALLSNYLGRVTSVDMSNNDYSTSSTRPYGVVNGIPYYSIHDNMWEELKWKNSPFSDQGHEIATLASILTTFNMFSGNGRAITPSYILGNWFTEEHPEWYNDKGILPTFYSSNGLQSLTETYVKDKPLQIEGTTKAKEMIKAMQDNKLVMLTPLGGSTSNEIFGGRSSNVVIGHSADETGSMFLVNDPQYPDRTSDIVLPNEALSSAGTISGIIFSNPYGKGLPEEPINDIDAPKFKKSIWETIKENAKGGLSALSSIFDAMTSMFDNLLASLLGDGKYKSIFSSEDEGEELSEEEAAKIAELSYLNSEEDMQQYLQSTYVSSKNNGKLSNRSNLNTLNLFDRSYVSFSDTAIEDMDDETLNILLEERSYKLSNAEKSAIINELAYRESSFLSEMRENINYLNAKNIIESNNKFVSLPEDKKKLFRNIIKYNINYSNADEETKKFIDLLKNRNIDIENDKNIYSERDLAVARNILEANESFNRSLFTNLDNIDISLDRVNNFKNIRLLSTEYYNDLINKNAGVVTNSSKSLEEFNRIYPETMKYNSGTRAIYEQKYFETFGEYPQIDESTYSRYNSTNYQNYLSNAKMYGPAGGEDDEYDLTTVTGVFGKFSSIIDTHLGKYLGSASGKKEMGEETDKPANILDKLTNTKWTANITGTPDTGDGKSAYGLVRYAVSLKNLGCRYVWGGSGKKLTESYYKSLKSIHAKEGTTHNAQYYREKFDMFGGGYVSDCSGLIRGYTGSTSHTANSLYNSSTDKGTISKIPNKYLYTPGILVFRKSTENSNMVHVGILMGDGNVIHTGGYCANSSSDVQIEKLSSNNWTHWGKSKYLNYATTSGQKETSPFTEVALGGENDFKTYIDDIRYSTPNEVAYLLNTLGGRITQTVGMNIDPTTGIISRHRGTDIAALYNTPIQSPVSGKIVENKSESYGSDYGNYVVIKDNTGKKHLIAHMNNASQYRIGSEINTGDILGYVGSSGRSTGPHVHYEVRQHEHIVDPLSTIDASKHGLTRSIKTNLNIMESKLDEVMSKNGSSLGGQDDILTMIGNSSNSDDRLNEVVDSLRDIVTLLTGWSTLDADSKNRILDAMDGITANNGSTVNLNTTNNTVNRSTDNDNSTNIGTNRSYRSTESALSSGGRSLHEIIARK